LPGMNISVTGRRGIWNERLIANIAEEVSLVLYYYERKEEIKEKGGYTPLSNIAPLNKRRG